MLEPPSSPPKPSRLRPDEQEYADPAPGDRLKVASAVGALVVGLAVLHIAVVRPTLAWVGTLPVCEQTRWLSGLIVGCMALLPLICLALFLPKGIKVWRHGRWPHPGMWVWQRMPVRHGWRARMIAVMMFGITVAALPAPFFTWQVISPLIDRACASPHHP